MPPEQHLDFRLDGNSQSDVKMKISIFCIVVLVVVACSAESRHKLDLIDTQERDVFDADTDAYRKQTGVETGLVRRKRSKGSVLFTVALFFGKATSLGLSLGAALSEGCLYHPSICTNRDEIERLDKLIQQKTQLYEQEYINTKKTYYDLRSATINNGYIEYYINQTMQIVETLQDIEESLSAELELNLPRLSRMHETSKNGTFQEYLKLVIGNLETRLSDLNNMLEQHKQDALVGIVVQYVIEASINKFMKSFQRAYSKVANEDIIASTQNDLWARMEGAEVTLKAKTGILHKLKLVPKAFKQMAKNAGQTFRNFGKSVKKWGRIKNWKGFKGKLMHILQKPIQKLKSIKSFFNPQTRAKFVKNYRLSWSKKIMKSFGIVFDVISQIINFKEWERVSSKMEEARKQYEIYHRNLVAELSSITAEKTKMEGYWLEIIDIFKHVSLPYKALVVNASAYHNFSDVIGLARLPVDTSGPLFSIDFNQLTKQNIRSKQLAVINFMKDVNNNMTVIEDKMRSRQVLYNNTLSKSKADEPVVDMLSDITSILNFSPSMTMKSFGQELKMRDMVCTISVLRPDIEEYDFFPLESFRPRCEINSTMFEILKSEAASKRKTKLMRTVIKRDVNGGHEESLSKLIDAVHNSYSGLRDKDLAQYGRSITDRDILCTISEMFPSRQKYDYIDVNVFRPNCSVLKTRKFQQMLNQAKNLRSLSQEVQTSLDTCSKYHYCPCLASVAKSHHATEEDVLEIIKHLNAAWKPSPAPQFCGPTGCGCKHF